MIGGAKGIGIGIDFGLPNLYRKPSGKSYIDPDVLASLRVVTMAYGKTNNDSDRAVVKNLVDASNPFVISNAAFKLNSGFGKYEITFQYFPYIENVTNVSDSKVVFGIGGQLLIPYSAITENIPSFKIKVNGLSGTYHFRYYYRSSDGVQHSVNMAQDGYYELPICYNVQSSSDGTNCGFANNGNDVVTITQIPSFEGAFVTDGVDDLITSTKTVQEMLGGSNEITVVSMIHQIELNSTHNKGFTNYIETIDSSTSYVRTQSNVAGKTGIYGYTYNNATQLLINNILGDKNDYERSLANASNILSNSRFSVAGGINNTNTSSSVAWYWTIIANKVLTTDQINQVIAYFNLDRTLNPDILCNTIKQGITNENHAEFGDKLIDFSGNGRDIQLNNIAWNKDSGIGKYGMDFLEWKSDSGMNFTSTKLTSTKPNLSGGWLTFRNVSGLIPETKVKVSGAPREFVFIGNNNGTDDKFSVTINNGVYTIPEFTLSSASGFYINNNSGDWSNLVIEQIPSHAGALCFDGVEDYGKVTGLPIYKDYTVVADYVRTFAKENVQDAPILSKSQVTGDGAFLFNYLNANSVISSYSFGTNNVLTNVSDSERKIYYQSKYVNGGKSINSGTGTDYDSMWLGTYRDDSQIFFTGAIYSLMTFPYSMSEFLIERQLKKHKLGTLYPDMVEWRPIYTSNVNDYTITKATYFGEAGQYDLALGNHYPIGARLRIYVKPSGAVDEVTSIKVNGVELTYDYISSDYGYAFNGTLSSKSPQKIDITIDEYIRYEDIVQPYPILLRFNDENGNGVSWGGKFRVGSTITRIGSIADPESNLLNGLYSISGLSLNDKAVTSSTSIVEKQMVFKTTATYLLDNNEPKCILSPRLLRIPNSSYKILGHIPDISGHGNHGVIHNSAYAGMSGANGYPYDYNKSSDFSAITNYVKIINSEKFEYFGYTNRVTFYKKTSSYKGKIKITGLNNAIASGKIRHFQVYTNSTTDTETSVLTTDGIYNINITGIGDATNVYFYILPVNTAETGTLDEPIYIEQIGEYEGAYCLDGVDDFITIPTTVGGKQVLMKVNWQSYIAHGMLYDQRGYANEFAIWNSDKYNDDETDTIPAYSARNNGQTYIDGILNNNIKASELRAITHNITITNELSSGVNNTYPVIGANKTVNAYFANMSLYDFMLFDEISTDEEILTLNEYVGIEGNTDDLFN